MSIENGISDKMKTFISVVATIASFCGYVGLFAASKCGLLNLPADWWALVLAATSFMPLAMIPFFFFDKRNPTILSARWIAGIVWTLFLVGLAMALGAIAGSYGYC
jgi:hypothetical protein